MAKTGPNDPCACGSGKKFKKCCGAPGNRHPARDRLADALVCHQAGRLDEAAAIYRALLAERPRNADARHYLGLIAFQQGDFTTAEREIRQALTEAPGHPAYLCNLANALKRLGRIEEARQAYRASLSDNPGFFQGWFNLALIEEQSGRYEAALENIERAILLAPRHAEAHFVKASALYSLHRRDEALDFYRKTITLDPDHHRARENLASLLLMLGDSEAAIREMGGPEAGGRTRTADEISLMLQTLLPHDPLTLKERHRAAMARWFPDAAPRRPRPPPTGRIRVAVLSPDFCEHPMRLFFRPIARHLDRERFSLSLYYTPVRFDDEFTEEFRQGAERWVDCRHLDDAALIDDLQTHQADVLIDLAGLTLGGRPGVVAARTAPVQLTMLGHLGPIGLPQLDYRVSDPQACPPGAEAYFSEHVLRLPVCQWCYVPDQRVPEIGVSSREPGGPPRFGYLGSAGKIGDAVVALWAKVLRQAPGSTLVLSATAEMTRVATRARFSRHGIDAERLEFLPLQPYVAHMASHLDIDVFLDAFPYTGGTTVCDALYMGTPVVSLAVDSPVGRGGVSLLHAIGAGEWIAEDPAAYGDIALTLAARGTRHADRIALRQRMAASPLMNAEAYVHAFEELLTRISR